MRHRDAAEPGKRKSRHSDQREGCQKTLCRSNRHTHTKIKIRLIDDRFIMGLSSTFSTAAAAGVRGMVVRIKTVRVDPNTKRPKERGGRGQEGQKRRKDKEPTRCPLLTRTGN